MARASKEDSNDQALRAGEGVEGSVTGMTDAPQDRATAPTSRPAPQSDEDTTRAPEAGPVDTTHAPSASRGTESPTASGPTQVADHSAYVEAAQQGYWGEVPAPGANQTYSGPASGDNALNEGTNMAGAIKLGPEVVAPGEDADRVVEVVPPGTRVEGTPELDKQPDPTNAEQYGNGPALDN